MYDYITRTYIIDCLQADLQEFFKGVKEQFGGFLQFCQNNLEDFCNFWKVSGSLWHLQVRVTAVGIFP